MILMPKSAMMTIGMNICISLKSYRWHYVAANECVGIFMVLTNRLDASASGQADIRNNRCFNSYQFLLLMATYSAFQ
ncbi:MAG TPA: hypothetical protein DD666_22050 [Advenella kashmirensis]|uniref:Uncharacterized protein n=1 Tax=Advenella kashmirensis TaxID=310575 RepID=A0A356LMI8_9BURK|nr:hypothetical protein [Advenella kashmirensis]